MNCYELEVLQEGTERERAGVQVRALHNVCPRSSYPFYIVGFYMNWVTTSWTYSSKSLYEMGHYFLDRRYLVLHRLIKK